MHKWRVNFSAFCGKVVVLSFSSVNSHKYDAVSPLNHVYPQICQCWFDIKNETTDKYVALSEVELSLPVWHDGSDLL